MMITDDGFEACNHDESRADVPQILVLFVHMLGVDIRETRALISFNFHIITSLSFLFAPSAHATPSGPHHARLLPPLLEKLGDSKIVLRQMVTRVLMQLMQVRLPW